MPLKGKNKYTLTFDMNKLPPVCEFWSIPLYAKDGFFIQNPIKRYTVNSFMQDQGEFYINGENELTFYIQPERPKILIRPKTGCHPQRMRGFA